MEREIKSLRPYFYSIREIKGNATVDLLIPVNWKSNITSTEGVKIVELDSNESKVLISIITKITEDGLTYPTLFTVGKEIIKFNLEEEEKELLFKQKMKELENIFKTSDLDKLKQIKFSEDEKQSGLATIGDSEGRTGDKPTEEETD